MSVYNVYFKTASDNIEVDIPDIYKDADSETNSEQIKVYICNKLGMNYDSVIFDLKRNKIWKRKCNNEIVILDNDELYFYLRDNSQDIDIKRLKLETGFRSINNALYCTNVNSEKLLNKILSEDELYTEKINILFNDLSHLINNETIKDFIENFIIYLNTPLKLKISFPFNEYNGGWFFGFMNNKKPHGFGFYYDYINKIYYEGRFVNDCINYAKCLNINTYFSYNDLYINYKECGKGMKVYLDIYEKYEGFFNEGIYSGGGKLINNNGLFTGLFKDGLANGYGCMIYKNGDIYSGFWSNNKRNIYGKIIYNNGNYYSGTWIDDYINIFGMFYDSNINITYIGTFNNGKRTFKKDEHIIIDGSFLDSDIIGEHCNEIESSENEYIQKSTNTLYLMEKLLLDTFCNTKQNNLNDCRQKYYIGHYDLMQNFYGFGKLFYNRNNKPYNNDVSSYEVYSNEYLKNKYNGYRTYHTTFSDGLPNGFGMIEFENGDRYIGGISKGEVSGNGTLFKKDGTKIKAFWNRNISICKVV